MESIEPIKYGNTTFHNYCKEHGLCYSAKLRKAKNYLKAHPKKSEEEAIKEIMENAEGRNTYFYKGYTLYTYCMLNNLKYDTIQKRIVKILKKDPTVSPDDAVEQALAQSGWIKYYYGKKTLRQYCQENGFDINEVTRKIRKILKSSDMTLEQAIKDVITYYENKRYYTNINKIFKFLRSSQNIEEELLEKIITYLNIDPDNLRKLQIEERFNLATGIALIWHFYDSEPGARLSISNNKLKEILLYVRALSKTQIEDVPNMDFGYLFKMYKTGLYDTRYFILLKEMNVIYYNIFKIQNNLSLNLKRGVIDDIADEAGTYLLELLEKIDNNVTSKVITYIIKALRGYLFDHILKIKEDNKVLAIQTGNEKYTRPRKSVIERIPNQNSNATLFDSDTMIFLSSLDPIFRDLIIYKFQEGLSNNEISEILNISLEELECLEQRMICELRENEAFKNFFLGRN